MAVKEPVQVAAKFDWQLMLRPGTYHNEDAAEIAQRWADTANELENTIAVRKDRIRRNENLSERGKTEQLQELRQQLRPRLDQFTTQANSVERARLRTMQQMTEPEPDGDPVALEMRAGEIRRYFRDTEPAAVYSAVQAAAAAGDWETVKAIENAPRSAPVGDPDTLDRLRRERLSERFPTEARKAEDQETLRDLLRQMADTLSRRIEE